MTTTTKIAKREAELSARFAEREDALSAIFADAGMTITTSVRRRTLTVCVGGTGFEFDESLGTLRIRDHSKRGVLIATPRPPRGGWSYSSLVTLVACDEGVPFARRVKPTCLTVDAAFASITPAAAKHPDTCRQGDWFFQPCRRLPVAADIQLDGVLGGSRHSATEVASRVTSHMRKRTRLVRVGWMDEDWHFEGDRCGVKLADSDHIDPATGIVSRQIIDTVAHHKTTWYARGTVSAPDHADLVLDGWHVAVPAPRTMARAD